MSANKRQTLILSTNDRLLVGACHQLDNTKLHEWRVYLQRWFLGFKDMRSMRTLRQKRHTGTAYAKIGDYILGVVFHPKPSSVSDVAGIQSVHASLN